jgi:hypothetical protein
MFTMGVYIMMNFLKFTWKNKKSIIKKDLFILNVFTPVFIVVSTFRDPSTFAINLISAFCAYLMLFLMVSLAKY